MLKKCLICKKEFKTSHKETKYCSQKCYGIYTTQRLTRLPSVRKEKKYIGKKTIIRYCLNCKKEIRLCFSSIKSKSRAGKFCSQKCWKEYNNKNGWNREKEKHWNWKGGITPELQKRINNPVWKIIRKKVYARDNWTCQICGIKCNKYKGQIQCHHIIPYRITQDNSESNLITLCASCHGKEEHKYYSSLRN